MPKPAMRLRWSSILLCLLAAACSRPAPVETSSGLQQPASAAPTVQRMPQPEIDWSPVQLEAGNAWVSCSPDYHQGEGAPILSLAYLDLRRVLQDCRASGLLRLRYVGKVTPSFAALAERMGKVASDLRIGKRILDIDSTGGTVEAALRAGDAIGENDWTIWVRNDSHCYSACVLLLPAGDMRVLAGPVGIHRMIRVQSTASSRRELGEELRKVSEDLRNYLERNGASLELYDMMSTVPNRSLRILTDAELERLGLTGENAVEDDLNRIRLARRCGSDFLRRKDAFRQAYEAQCLRPAQAGDADVDAINACGLALRARFGFPDPRCPDVGPMSELDGALLAIPEAPPPPEIHDAPAPVEVRAPAARHVPAPSVAPAAQAAPPAHAGAVAEGASTPGGEEAASAN
ncbi:hypothetical protein [Thermomonas flagellata]|uniref:hypothetical protein n=1 Tax=Thermomonas flagellata TaxID=2888524 RepID=UPI001F034529|nr:hypothetical protein [Thermomonas flagellata]